MVRPILKLGQSVLDTPAGRVDDFGPGTQALIDDMIETMYAAPGIGLAAPQIGVALRLFVIDLSVGRRADDLHVFINPDVVERSGLQLEEEGCLSVPGFTATVVRPARLLVRGADRRGVVRSVEGTGLMARALQHEIDHLDGVLYINRIRGIERSAIERRVRQLAQQGRW